MPDSIQIDLSQGAGDAVAMSAAIRDLHLAHPQKYRVWITGQCRALYDHSPDVEQSPVCRGVPQIVVENRVAEWSDKVKFLTLWHKNMGTALGVEIPCSEHRPILYLSDEEKEESPVDGDYVLCFSGGKSDFTVKWVDPSSYEAAAAHLIARGIKFVQVGAAGTWTRPVAGSVNLVGQTGLRDLMQLVWHSRFVISSVSFGMHLSAALGKPCIVMAGGGEHPSFFGYPGHRILSIVGEMPCAPCWKMKVSDCPYPIQIGGGVKIAECMSRVGGRLIDAIREKIGES